MFVRATDLEGVFVLDAPIFRDTRGDFQRLYCERALQPALQGRRILQANRSLTRMAGAVRGLHFQKSPAAECKIIHCLRGQVFDVALDLRSGRWWGTVLEAGSGRAMLVPEGCAHGFQALSPNCELVYLSTAFYEPELEGCVHPQDPHVNILWPLPVSELSVKDAAARGLRSINYP